MTSNVVDDPPVRRQLHHNCGLMADSEYAHPDPEDESPTSGRRARRGGDIDGRAAEGVEHLQTAAKELIAAARAFLDVMDDFVDDRERLNSAVSSLGSAVRSASGQGPTSEGSDDPLSGYRVQHIPVD